MAKKKTRKSGKRINIFLDQNTHTQAKLVSVLDKITLNEYFEKAIEEAIKEDKSLVKNLG